MERFDLVAADLVGVERDAGRGGRGTEQKAAPSHHRSCGWALEFEGNTGHSS